MVDEDLGLFLASEPLGPGPTTGAIIDAVKNGVITPDEGEKSLTAKGVSPSIAKQIVGSATILFNLTPTTPSTAPLIAQPTPITAQTDAQLSAALDAGTAQGIGTPESIAGLSPSSGGDLFDDLFGFNPPPDPGTAPVGDPGVAVTGDDIAAGIPLTTEQIQQDLSATRGGRGDLFNQFLGGLAPTTNVARSALGRQFNPLSAGFALSGLTASPTGNIGEGNFFTSLGNAEPALTGTTFSDLISGLSGIFGTGATPTQQTQAEFLGANQPTTENIIQSGFAAQFGSLLQQAARDVALKNIQSFQGQDLTTPLFQAFLEGQLGGGQGFFAPR